MELGMRAVSKINPQHKYHSLTYDRRIETRTAGPGALVEQGAVWWEALQWVCITNYVELICIHDQYSQESRVRTNCSIS